MHILPVTSENCCLKHGENMKNPLIVLLITICLCLTACVSDTAGITSDDVEVFTFDFSNMSKITSVEMISYDNPDAKTSSFSGSESDIHDFIGSRADIIERFNEDELVDAFLQDFSKIEIVSGVPHLNGPAGLSIRIWDDDFMSLMISCTEDGIGFFGKYNLMGELQDFFGVFRNKSDFDALIGKYFTDKHEFFMDSIVETMEIGEFRLEYELLQERHPGCFRINIDEEGTLTVEYSDYRDYGFDPAIITKELTHSQLTSLIDVLLTNDFFNLPRNMDDDSGEYVTSGPKRTLTLVHNGITYKREGYNTRNENFLAICKAIEKLAPPPKMLYDEPGHDLEGEIWELVELSADNVVYSKTGPDSEWTVTILQFGANGVLTLSIDDETEDITYRVSGNTLMIMDDIWSMTGIIEGSTVTLVDDEDDFTMTFQRINN